MDEKVRCQSCGMPLSDAFGNYGTQAGGSKHPEYCLFCFKDGAFTLPHQTMDEMIQSSIEITQCLRQDYEAADAELNRVYQAAMAHIDKADYMPARTRRDWKEMLREAQRNWIAFKEKDCDLLQLEWWQGSGANAASLGCLITKTETRTDELKERYAIE